MTLPTLLGIVPGSLVPSIGVVDRIVGRFAGIVVIVTELSLTRLIARLSP